MVERVPEAAVDHMTHVGYQRRTGDVAAASVRNWEMENTPQEVAQSATEATAEIDQLTWTRPIWQPISVPCRCATSVVESESQSDARMCLAVWEDVARSTLTVCSCHRFPGICQELLTSIEAWEEADIKSAADFAVQVDRLRTSVN